LPGSAAIGQNNAWLADLASTLTQVDDFLRSPAGHAALEDFYAARGSSTLGYNAGLLVDDVSFPSPTSERAPPATRALSRRAQSALRRPSKVISKALRAAFVRRGRC